LTTKKMNQALSSDYCNQYGLGAASIRSTEDADYLKAKFNEKNLTEYVWIQGEGREVAENLGTLLKYSYKWLNGGYSLESPKYQTHSDGRYVNRYVPWLPDQPKIKTRGPHKGVDEKFIELAGELSDANAFGISAQHWQKENRVLCAHWTDQTILIAPYLDSRL